MPSRVLACWAKISKMRDVLSNKRRFSPSCFSNSRWWRGESSSSKITTWVSVSSASAFSSFTLPAPMNVFALGRLSFWVISPTTSSPAVSASRASSSSESLRGSKPSSPEISTPTRKARSLGGVAG